jgi:tetratricopeptide (TPR) repeat protein
MDVGKAYHPRMHTRESANRDQELALALEHHAAGRFDDAEQAYQRLHAANRGDAEVIYLLGLLCSDLGLFEAACKFLERALAITPAFPEASAQLAIALNGFADVQASSGRLTEAQGLLEQALASAPGNAQSLQGLGRVALLRGDAAAAEARLTESLVQRGNHAETLNWLGLAQLQLRNYAAAEASLRRALELQPDLNQARNNLGLALQHQGRLGEALASFEEVLAQAPEYQNARINLANALRILGKHAAARRELETVLAITPEAVDALNNLGAVFQDVGLAELAHATLTRALELSPASPQIRWNLALTQLQLGDFTNGWRNFESRWEGCENLKGGYEMPPERAWRGEALEGKRLLLWAEQGFGDTLQFIRFAQDAALQGATASVRVPPELTELVRGAPGVSAVIPNGGPLPAYDFHCPLMSLPYYLDVSPGSAGLRGATPYLAAAQDLTETWRRRLTAHPGLKVGLVWAGSSRRQSAELAAIDARRSIPLERLAPILSVTGCTFFSLQKGAAAAELHRSSSAAAGGSDAKHIHGGDILDFSAEWTDFSDTAAFIANLDLVISVDTAVAHLAGALGKPVWLLNRYDSCWRWLLARDDSPWYSTLLLFRQPRLGEWDPVIAMAAAALAEVVALG